MRSCTQIRDYNTNHGEILQLDHRENRAYTLVTKETISVHGGFYEH